MIFWTFLCGMTARSLHLNRAWPRVLNILTHDLPFRIAK